MRYAYGIPGKWSTANVVKVPALHGYVITSLEVQRYQRGNGYGRELLKCICTDADSEQVDLYLAVQPDPDVAFDVKAWYGRYGFVEWEPDEDPSLMWRPVNEQSVERDRRRKEAEARLTAQMMRHE